MPGVRQIPNAAQIYGLPINGSIYNEQICIEMVNNSAGARQHGDVVVVNTPFTGLSATTSTTLNDKTVIGVVTATQDAQTVATTFAVGAVMPVCVLGVARVNVGANTPAAGDSLTQSTVAAVAITNATAPTANNVIGSILGVCLSATKDANNCVLALVKQA